MVIFGEKNQIFFIFFQIFDFFQFFTKNGLK